MGVNEIDWMEQDSNGSLSLSSVEFSPGRETYGYKGPNLDFYNNLECSSPFDSCRFKYSPKQIFHCL